MNLSRKDFGARLSLGGPVSWITWLGTITMRDDDVASINIMIGRRIWVYLILL